MEKTVFVVPAFESKDNVVPPLNKGQLLSLIETGEVRPFYSQLCSKCQVSYQVVSVVIGIPIVSKNHIQLAEMDEMFILALFLLKTIDCMKTGKIPFFLK